MGLAIACADPAEPGGDIPEGGDEPDTEPPVYISPPPAGRLPWPQHDPSWTASEYEADLNRLWIINNFGVYQGGEDKSSVYLHNGLDVVLPNGTPIYAVEAGVVRSNIGGNEFYRTLVIEDLDEPGMAWGYTHVNGFRVVPGDTVHQGTRLASVNFLGVEHIHLDRMRLLQGGSWNVFGNLIHLQPDTFFVYDDTEPPVFEGRFRYVRDGTDSAFIAADVASPVVVSGDVDIIAGIRDPGVWARSPGPFGGPDTYGDRNAVTRIELEIAAPDGTTLRVAVLDMSLLELLRETQLDGMLQTLSIYQHYESVEPAAPPLGNYNRRFSFYIVTHAGGESDEGPLDHRLRSGDWPTASLDETGQPRFPNGDYVATVRAWDFKGNMAERSETVRVAN